MTCIRFRLAIGLASLFGMVDPSHRAIGAEPSAASQAASGINANSEDVLASLPQRFLDADTDEVPDFQRHVIPLMGRLGCNGRACHGSFQGRGGFQLSLFGYDFQADHEALMDDSTGRVDVDDVDESLILYKPSDADAHEGGKRFDLGSWQHHVLQRWIESGAKYAGDEPQRLARLEVIPSEIRFDRPGQQISLKAIAHWQDGSREDVTPLSRFSTNDEAVAAIDSSGHVTADASGDTHVVVYYDNAVVAVPVLAPRTSQLDQAGQDLRALAGKSAHPIDQLVLKKLDKLGIAPSAVCSDEEFIRRATLDVTGVLPAANDVRAFLADASADKRHRLVDQLLDSPAYAAWWATRMSDWTGNSDEQLNNVLPVRGAATRLWHRWLQQRFASNMPYDQIVEGIVTAESREPDESYTDYCESMTQACQAGSEDRFAERSGMPLYWTRLNFRKPEERAIGFAYAFLGVRIECAQCHKHPFDQWSKNDFDQFASLFSPIQYNGNRVAKDAQDEREKLLESLKLSSDLKGGKLRQAISKLGQKGETVPFGELLVNVRGVSPKVLQQRKKAKALGRKLPPLKTPSGKILGAEDMVQLDEDPRPELMQWLRSPDNPYFSKAIVNRVWSNYFSAGIVDPTDDMNLANPPSNGPLLDHLANQFIANGFDLKWLHRTILSSETYQRSAQTHPSNASDLINFSHHVPRRYPAEVIYDAITLATAGTEQADQLRDGIGQLAIADGKPRLRNRQDFALQVFGQSLRETNCDCDRSDSPSLLQSIYLMNDADMHKRLTSKDGWVAEACRSVGIDPPKPQGGDAGKAVQRQIETAKKQIAARITQFNREPEKSQKRKRPGLQKQYNAMKKRLARLNVTMPPLRQLIEDPDSWTDASPAIAMSTAKSSDLNELLDEAYLRTLSRFPDAEEREIAGEFITQAESPSDAIQSFVWALVNTKEFILSH
ncbi:MAG: DUF1549 and DUF1553 domain-containing protein [Planctomycetota bacterium]